MPIGKDSIKTRVAKVAAEAPAETVKVEAPAEVKPAAKKPASKKPAAPKAPKAEGETPAKAPAKKAAAPKRLPPRRPLPRQRLLSLKLPQWRSLQLRLRWTPPCWPTWLPRPSPLSLDTTRRSPRRRCRSGRRCRVICCNHTSKSIAELFRDAFFDYLNIS